jgi:hypothetical protein
MKDESIDLAEKERMMREAGITQDTLVKIQAWIDNANKKGESDD